MMQGAECPDGVLNREKQVRPVDSKRLPTGFLLHSTQGQRTTYQILQPLQKDALQCVDGTFYPQAEHSLYLAKILEQIDPAHARNEEDFSRMITGANDNSCTDAKTR